MHQLPHFSDDLKHSEMITAQTKSAGVAAVGGQFSLTDHNGKPFSSADLKGEFSVLYFGFTQCPDVCPDELDKITEAVHAISNPDLIDDDHPLSSREANGLQDTLSVHNIRSRKRSSKACKKVCQV